VKKGLVVIWFLVHASLLWGQARRSDWAISGGAVAGVLLPHHSEMRYLVDGHIKSAELNIHLRTDGTKDWHHWYNFPTWGVSLNYFDFSTDLLGWGASAIFGVGLDLDQKKRLHLKMGVGGGYIDKPFNLDENFQQTAIGSHLNASLSVGLHTNIRISENWQIQPGLTIHHFSNGAFKMPNSGINMALLKLIVEYDGSGQINPPREERKPKLLQTNLFVGSTFGLKQTAPFYDTRYLALNVFTTWQKRFTPKTSLGVETGLNYNASNMDRHLERKKPAQSEDNYRLYIGLHHMLHFDPFAFRFQAGSYLWPSFEEDGLIFFRYHLVYQLNRIDIFAGLKSHFAKADHTELGLAYRIR
jgi:hypothetical protein